MVLLLLYPKHVIKLSWYNLRCYSTHAIIIILVQRVVCVIRDDVLVFIVVMKCLSMLRQFKRTKYIRSKIINQINDR